MRLAGALAAAIAGWVGVLAATALAVQPEAVIAVGPRPALVAADDSALVAVGRGWTAFRPAREGAVRRLYAGGAWLVLPAPGAACLGR